MRRMGVVTSVVLALSMVVPGRAEAAVVLRDIPYKTVAGVVLRLDVFMPADEVLHPAVLLVHGGSWSRGDKSEWANEGLRLAASGFVAFAADYRLAPPGGTSHAITPVEDLRDAITWIRANAGTYGVDPSRVGALGDSAGGNLVLMLAVTGSNGADKADAAVSWSGPTDLRLHPSSGRKNYVGCSATACPASWDAASPRFFVDPADSPIYLANSANEKTTQVDEANAMADELSAAGVPFELNILSGTRHARAYQDDVWAPSLAFLHRYLDAATSASARAGPAAGSGAIRAGPSQVVGKAPTWMFATGGRILSSPAVVGGVVYVGSEDHLLYAVDAASGSLRWKSATAGPITATPAVSGGVVYVGSQDGELHAFDAATGAPRWSTSLGTLVDGSPVVSTGTVYVGGNNGVLYALDAVTGATKWTAATGRMIQFPPAVSGTVVYAGSNTGTLSAFVASTGATKWSKAGKLFYWCPRVASGVVYVTDVAVLETGSLEAFDANTGAKRWSASTTNLDASCPAVDGGTVYVGSTDGSVYAFNASTGSQLWKTGTGDQIYSSPAVAGGVVYIGSDDRNLYALDAGTGAIRWTASTGGVIVSSPAISDGRVYVGSADNLLYAFAA
jgi:outer membrane protein assembly factor BamB/dienelactone hydrolase